MRISGCAVISSSLDRAGCSRSHGKDLQKITTRILICSYVTQDLVASRSCRSQSQIPSFFFCSTLCHICFSHTASRAIVGSMAQSSPVACAHIDNSFGPHAGGCRDGFDFTLLFEETILTLLPLGLLVLGLFPRVWFLLKRPKKITVGGHSVVVKIVGTYARNIRQTYLLR